MKYNDNLDPDDQLSLEERIAAILYDFGRPLYEEDCQELGQKVLYMVLEKFRPDLFGNKPEGPSYQGLLDVPHDQLARHAQEGWNLANARTKEMMAYKTALEHALTQLLDLKANWPEKELHEPLDHTIKRSRDLLGPDEDEDDGERDAG